MSLPFKDERQSLLSEASSNLNPPEKKKHLLPDITCCIFGPDRTSGLPAHKMHTVKQSTRPCGAERVGELASGYPAHTRARRSADTE